MRWCRGCQRAVTSDHPGYEDCKTPETFDFYYDVDERDSEAVLASDTWMKTQASLSRGSWWQRAGGKSSQ